MNSSLHNIKYRTSGKVSAEKGPHDSITQPCTVISSLFPLGKLAGLPIEASENGTELLSSPLLSLCPEVLGADPFVKE